ncbi:MAG: histidine phosphatase family protein [Dehalococcoidales bacterium]|nr:histidine phosphatase family protein [Dehalococcoidales bacterium]
MTEIMLVRHGETEWNVGEVFRGRIDIELNDTGFKQAQLLADYLSDLKIEAVYSSPLKRAIKTAEAIARRHKLDVKIAPDLIDLDFGQWQGLPLGEVRDKYKALYLEWASRPDRVKIPAGESLDDVRGRAIGVVEEAMAKYNGTVVLVSHRVVNKVLICALLGLDNSHFWNLRQDTCGVTTFNCEDGRYVLTGHNNTCFLKEIQRGRLIDF